MVRQQVFDIPPPGKYEAVIVHEQISGDFLHALCAKRFAIRRQARGPCIPAAAVMRPLLDALALAFDIARPRREFVSEKSPVHGPDRTSVSRFAPGRLVFKRGCVQPFRLQSSPFIPEFFRRRQIPRRKQPDNDPLTRYDRRVKLRKRARCSWAATR